MNPDGHLVVLNAFWHHSLDYIDEKDENKQNYLIY